VPPAQEGDLLTGMLFVGVVIFALWLLNVYCDAKIEQKEWEERAERRKKFNAPLPTAPPPVHRESVRETTNKQHTKGDK
jgi:hypothetical protein